MHSKHSQVPSRMLIVDDDGINREILKNIFQDQFQFLEAETGLEGLLLAQQYAGSLAAILSDVNMPVMDGLEMVEKLHAMGLTARVPVFLITANDEIEVAEKAYNLGIMGVINKPVVPFIALRRVQLIRELFQARDALARQVERQEQELRENVETIDALHRNTLEAMASAIEFRDVESGEHTNRIYGITKAILSQTEMGWGLTAEEIENISIGSIMHDVGKIAISDVILNKPGKLTREEFELMKEHTLRGGELMERLNRLQSHPSYRYAWDIALHHHERWDGRGYPHGLKGEQISVWSQVVSIADVYDALVSPRVYKRAFSPDKAVEMICNGECGQFNPKLVECFLQVEPQLRQWYPENGEAEPETPAGAAPARQEECREPSDMLLLTAAIQSAYDMIISVNLTKNSFYMMDFERFRTHCAGHDGVFDDLIAAGASSIPESHRQRFVDTFGREQLLKAYAEGKRSVNLHHPQYTDDGKVAEVSTTVLFVEDPRNGDIREITLSRYVGGGTTRRKRVNLKLFE